MVLGGVSLKFCSNLFKMGFYLPFLLLWFRYMILTYSNVQNKQICVWTLIISRWDDIGKTEQAKLEGGGQNERNPRSTVKTQWKLCKPVWPPLLSSPSVLDCSFRCLFYDTNEIHHVKIIEAIDCLHYACSTQCVEK